MYEDSYQLKFRLYLTFYKPHKLTRLVFFFTSICILCTSSLFGQSHYFKRYQVENGLSNSTVFCSLQDRNGFLWFGTKDGLNRFDGYNFKIFQTDADDTKSIGDNFIRSIYEDPNGGIWLGTNNGLYKYNVINENFSLAVATEIDIRDIAMDKNGEVWYISGSNLNRFNPATKKIFSFNPKSFFYASSISLSDDGTVWLSSNVGTLEKYNSKTNTFKSFDVFANSVSSSSRWIEKIRTFGNDYVFIATSTQGAKIFDIKTETYRDILRYNPDKTDIYARDFARRSADEFWIGTESGVFIYNIKTNKYINLRKSYNDPYSLSDNAVYTLTVDKEGGVWAGTFFGGVNYYPKQYTSFEKFFPDYSPLSLSGNAIREIRQDKYGNLWFGTEDAGLNKLENKGKGFIHYYPNGKKGSIAYSNIHGLLAIDNKLWIGTFEHGLDIMDIKSGKIVKHYDAGPSANQLKNNFIVTFYQTSKGEILIGTRSGLFCYNSASDDFSYIPYLSAHFVHSIIEDHTGTIWVGTVGQGLFYFNKKTKQSGNYKFDPKDKNSIGSNNVNAVYEDSDHTLWLATEGGGLCQLLPDKKTFKRITNKNGLPSNTAYKIIEDNDKNLWITSSKGLVFMDRDSKRLKIYSKANGLLNDQFNYNSAFKDKDGMLYFGSVKGLIKIDPTQFIKSSFVPPVYITGFQIYNEEVGVNNPSSPLKKSINFTDTIYLNYDQSSFSIDFASLSYTAPEMTEYAFKMVGLEKDWTYIKSNRKAYFTELSPGKYVFKVKAANFSGLWNGKEKQITILIAPPFWASYWAYLVYILLLVFLIYLGFSTYHNRHKAKNERKLELFEHEKEKEIYHAKIEFFTNVAHEIRTPLTLIKGPMEKIIMKVDEVPQIKNNLLIMERNTDRLLNLTNQLLDFRKTETNGFSLNFVKANIKLLLEDNYQRFKPLAEQKKIRFRINLPETPVSAYVDPEALNKILSNLLNNAVKYSKSKVKLTLQPLEEGESYLTLIVENDGYLIPKEMKEKVFETFYRIKETEKVSGSGMGLALARSLTQLHNGTLVMLPSENNMNIFSLTLPIHQDIEFNPVMTDKI